LAIAAGDEVMIQLYRLPGFSTDFITDSDLIALSVSAAKSDENPGIIPRHEGNFTPMSSHFGIFTSQSKK